MCQERYVIRSFTLPFFYKIFLSLKPPCRQANTRFLPPDLEYASSSSLLWAERNILSPIVSVRDCGADWFTTFERCPFVLRRLEMGIKPGNSLLITSSHRDLSLSLFHMPWRLKTGPTISVLLRIAVFARGVLRE